MIRPIPFSLAAVAIALLLACSETPEPQATAPPDTPVAEQAALGPRRVHLNAEAARDAGVKLAVMEETEVAESIEVAGRVTLDEDRTARVGSFADGVVTQCCKSVGAYVRKGDTLAEVHSHQTHEIVAEFLTAKADLAGQESQLQYAQQAHDRAAKLLDLKAGSLQEVQRTKTEVQAARTGVAAAKAAIERARAHLEFYGLDADEISKPGEEPHIEIRAPSSGTIVERSVKLGDVVSPTTSMYIISDLSRLWVIAQVPEQYLTLMRPGMDVEVRTRAFPGRGFRGRVTQVSTELDPDTKTVQVRCSVPNPSGDLKTGMYATVRLESEGKTAMLTIPETAIQRIDDEPVIFVAAGPDEFEVRPVREGRRLDDRVEILNGLRPGDEIAIEGAFVLKSELLKAELQGGE
ncbi:MAG: efflux RND transporter periplasmic adaptor subunit [Bryobacterales bacterium]|nr:efflux RND transporter periplasmic adaptor subunit [Acidobacteriota bacterium]MCB9385928.1 efflux RND transporter periplasmic adaptor subunit [Bryobacterales bacterium]